MGPIEFIDLVLRDASLPRSVTLRGGEERNPLDAIHGHLLLLFLLLYVVRKVIKFRAGIMLSVTSAPFEDRCPITTCGELLPQCLNLTT